MEIKGFRQQKSLIGVCLESANFFLPEKKLRSFVCHIVAIRPIG